jgi:exonuclease I
MRVKLSYTVDEEDVLAEAAKIINLSAEDLQQAVSLFAAVQKELRPETQEVPAEIVNLNKCYEMIEEFRKALLNVDTRLGEVLDIVQGYDDYLRLQKHDERQPPPPEESINEG